MNLPKFESKQFCWISLFAVLAVTPMLIRGIPGGNDAVQHYEFAQHVVDAIHAGEWFPHFAGNANHGFGDVGLRVYPPLSYYALALSYFGFGDWYAASIAVFFLIFLIGGLGVFLWSREFFDTNSSLAAAAIYTFAPFHLNEIYNNFLYAEFAAGAILPFCFLFLTRVIRNGNLRNILFLSVSYAFLISTHLPITIIGSIALAIYAVAMTRLSSFATYAKLGVSVIVGLLLSSFYWVRMISEMQMVKHSQSRFFANIWSYNENFLLSARTFTDFMNDGQSLWFGDLMLAATIAICIPAIFALRRSENWKTFGVPMVALLAAAIVFATPISYLIWNSLSLLQKVQFPWRWLNIATLAASVIVGAGSAAIIRRARSTHIDAIALALAAAVLPFVFLSAFVVKAPHFSSRSEFADRAKTLSEGETFEGWWPVWAKREAFSRKEKIDGSGRSSRVDEWLPTKRTFSVDEGAAGPVSLSTFYYPHWIASIEGKPIETDVSNEGLILLQIPNQHVHVELNFVEPTHVRGSIWISTIAWFLVIGLLIFLYARNVKSYATYS